MIGNVSKFYFIALTALFFLNSVFPEASKMMSQKMGNSAI